MLITVICLFVLLVDGNSDLNGPIVNIGKSRLFTAKRSAGSLSTSDSTTGSAKNLVTNSTVGTSNWSAKSVSSTHSYSTTTAAPKFDSDDLKRAIEVFKHYSKFQNFNQVFDEIAKESPNLNQYLESLVEGGVGEYQRLMTKMSPTATEFFTEVYLSTAAYGVEIIEHFKSLDKNVKEEIFGYYPKFTQFFKSKLFESVFYDVRLKKALEEEAAKKRASAKPKIQKAVSVTTNQTKDSSEDIDDDSEDTIDPYDEEDDKKVDDIEGSEVYPEEH